MQRGKANRVAKKSRSHNACRLPTLRREGDRLIRRIKTNTEAARGSDCKASVKHLGERYDMRGKWPGSLKRHVASFRKKFRRTFPRRENLGDCGLFDAAITPSSGKFRWEGIVERILSRGEIDRRSIVGYDQAVDPNIRCPGRYRARRVR